MNTPTTCQVTREDCACDSKPAYWVIAYTWRVASCAADLAVAVDQLAALGATRVSVEPWELQPLLLDSGWHELVAMVSRASQPSDNGDRERC